MGYCKFRNTLDDLRECFEHMDEELDQDADKEEIHAREKLIILCQQISEEYGGT